MAARDVDIWLATRVLTEIEPGVYALSDALRIDPFVTRAAAHCQRSERVCDALTSARLWGLPGVFAVGRPATIDLDAVPRTLVVKRRDGIRLLSRAATWFGLAEVMRPSQFSAWSHEVVGHHVDVVAGHRAVRLLADPSRAPHRRAVALLSATRRWQRPAASGLERRVRSSMRRRGVVGLDGSHRIHLADGLVVHPAVVDHESCWGIEIDHRGWHGGRHGSSTRQWIERALRHAGWTIERVTDTELNGDFGAVMSMLADRRAALVSSAAR